MAGLTFATSLVNFDYDLETWMEWLSKKDAYSWIDSAGDTPILAIIKSFPVDGEDSVLENAIEELFQAGTSIHIRVRDGETPLAIVAQRGLRPTVQKLVTMGVSVHCRNYFGTSILQSVRANIREAKRQSNELFMQDF